VSSLKQTKNNEQGLVAIIVTLIIMLILSLIVTGFAQLARREQREALDRQLASQALYAAESGINFAEDLIAGGDLDPYDDCSGLKDELSAIGNENERPTCILIDHGLPELKYENVQTTSSEVVPIEEEGDDLGSLTISWQNTDGDNNPTGIGCGPLGNVFSDVSDWGDKVGVLRVDLVPVDTLSLDDMRDNMFTAFLVPSSCDNAVVALGDAQGPTNQGLKVAANCGSGSSKRECAVQINGFANPTGKYYLRMKAIYNVADVVICPSDGYGCDPNKSLIGAQAEIDVTAKAADVLKRVQVRVGTDPFAKGSETKPEYTLDSAETICKLLEVTPDPADTTNGCGP
jgi:hypothetical protein